MDSIDEVIRTSSSGELTCGCWFDRDGTRQVGEWVPCDTHGAPARIRTVQTVTNTGHLVTDESDSHRHPHHECATVPRPPVRIRVFHNADRDALARGFRGDDWVVEVYAYDEPAADTTDLAIAERVFDLFNVGHDAEFGAPDHRALEYHDRRNRCLSVGDVIAIDGLFYACEGSGWTAIAKPRQDYTARRGTTPLYVPVTTDD